MPPKTRSRGVAPPSRVYHSTPTPAQAQFPPRRKVVRTYGKQNRKEERARTLRQQTLTQIDFVSSFEEDKDPIVLSSDSEDLESEEDEDKENKPKKEKSVSREDTEEEEDEEEEDEAPLSSGRKRRASSKRATTSTKARSKRRRTLGDENSKSKKDNRRKTLGDAPSSSHHTQTLTQFLGRDRDAQADIIKDSDDDDDDDDDDNDNEFENWLQQHTSPSPRLKLRSSRSPLKKNRTPLKTLHDTAPESVRAESVVPQTPSRRPRDEIPSSNQTTPLSEVVDRFGLPTQPNPSPLKIMSSPVASIASEAGSNAENVPPSSSLSVLSSAMIARYGPPDVMGPSPSQRKSSPSNIATTAQPKLSGQPKPRNATPKLVIEDTFATESWGSGDATTPTPLRTKTMTTPRRAKTPSADSSSLADGDEMETPTKPRRQRESPDLGDANMTPTPRKMKKVSPAKAKRVVLEIPDSDEDDEDFDVDENDNDENDDEGRFAVGPETQFVMSELASSEERPANTTPVPAEAAPVTQNSKSSFARPAKNQRRSPSPSSALTSLALPSSPPIAAPQETRRRLRKPLQHPVHAGTHTQPFESQRVPLVTLQALPAAGGHTDKLITVPPDTLAAILGGFEVYLTLPSRVLHHVVRFWLFDGSLLRYMACIEPGERHQGSWRYYLSQVYELNNPLEEADMREEGWIEDRYIPPAIVGQLLWNLQHAVFGVGSEEDTQAEASQQASLPPSSSQPNRPVPSPTPDLSVSQQVDAQLKSDIAHSTQFPTSDDILVPSTPDASTNEPTTTTITTTPKTAIKRPPSHLARQPTSYRASRPSQATTASQASTPEKSSSRPPLPPPFSSSSLTFQDVGDSSSPIRFPHSVPLGASSQLLSKSQMLPDSLVRDDARVPGEIWDSEEDVDERL